jgi:hypothetical protein
MTKKELVKRLQICRAGKCGECHYHNYQKHCTDDLIDDVYNFLLESKSDKIRCPWCGASHYYEDITTTNLVYYPTEYIDGKLVRKENDYTTECICTECKLKFCYSLHNGDISITPIISETNNI